MTSGDSLQALLSRQLGKELITQLASSFLKRHATLTSQIWGTAFATEEFKTILMGKAANEVTIYISFGAANPVVEVRDEQYHPELFAKFQQQAQESHRVRSAGNSNGDAITGADEPLLTNVLEYCGLHSSMVHLGGGSF